MSIEYKLTIVFLTLLGSSCISNADTSTHKVMNQFVSGIRINTNTLPLQILEDKFDINPPEGPMSKQTIKIFQLDSGKCLSLSTLNNESGFGGYEGFIVFKKNRILESLQRDLFFSNEEGSVTANNMRYSNDIDKSKKTKNILKNDFTRYSKKFNSNVTSICK